MESFNADVTINLYGCYRKIQSDGGRSVRNERRVDLRLLHRPASDRYGEARRMSISECACLINIRITFRDNPLYDELIFVAAALRPMIIRFDAAIEDFNAIRRSTERKSVRLHPREKVSPGLLFRGHFRVVPIVNKGAGRRRTPDMLINSTRLLDKNRIPRQSSAGIPAQTCFQ